MRTKLTAVCALALFVAVAGGTAEATGLIHTSGIAKGAITFTRLSPGVQKMVSAKAVHGKPGANGLDGATGQPGATGAKGATGAMGSTGPMGLQGDAGANGAEGQAGLKGNKGDTGLPGAPGTQGAPGTNGAPGLKGDPGTNGAPGAPGLKGDPGTNGTPGTNGSPGAKGDKGDKGDAGTYVVVTHVTGGDSNVCGGNWANDSYTRTLQFTMQPDGKIVVLRTYDGTFTTVAGESGPNDATCTLDQVGGKVGTFTGTDVVTVTGGHFYPNATCPANCTSDAMMATFFHGGTPAATRSLTNGWEYHYDLGAETMIQADDASRGGNEGDILAG